MPGLGAGCLGWPGLTLHREPWPMRPWNSPLARAIGSRRAGAGDSLQPEPRCSSLGMPQHTRARTHRFSKCYGLLRALGVTGELWASGGKSWHLPGQWPSKQPRMGSPPPGLLESVALGSTPPKAFRPKHGCIAGVVAVGFAFVLSVAPRGQRLPTFLALQARPMPVLAQRGHPLGCRGTDRPR